MRTTLMAICFMGFVASNGVAAVIDHWIKGKTAECNCDDTNPEENHTSWRYPYLAFRSSAVTRSVNRAIARDVLKALNLSSFPLHPHKCRCDDFSGLVFNASEYCDATYVSDRYVTLLCSTEERDRSGKGGTSYRTILFRIRGNRLTRLKPSELFRSKAAVKAVENILAKRITDDFKTGGSVNAYIDEADISGLAEAMVESAVFADGGMRFLVLGEHHAAFKALLSVDDLRKFVTLDVLNEIANSVAGRQP